MKGAQWIIRIIRCPLEMAPYLAGLLTIVMHAGDVVSNAQVRTVISYLLEQLYDFSTVRGHL